MTKSFCDRCRKEGRVTTLRIEVGDPATVEDVDEREYCDGCLSTVRALIEAALDLDAPAEEPMRIIP
jgi:hypothetical protein